MMCSKCQGYLSRQLTKPVLWLYGLRKLQVSLTTYLSKGTLPLTRALRMTVSSSELSCSGSWTVRRCPWSSIFWIWLAVWQSVITNTPHLSEEMCFFCIANALFSKITMPSLCASACKKYSIISFFPSSSFISLIRSSHTHFQDKDENPTLASLTLFPSVPHFSGNVNVMCICACLHAVHIALTSLTQLLMSVLWWAFGKVSSSSSWTLSISQQPLFISVTRMSATPPEPARISHGVELPMPLYIRCRRGHNVLTRR